MSGWPKIESLKPCITDCQSNADGKVYAYLSASRVCLNFAYVNGMTTVSSVNLYSRV